MLFDENTGGEFLFRLAQCDPLPQWGEPKLRNGESTPLSD
jgi:hypothetical protein